jgi:hypothetical protein
LIDPWPTIMTSPWWQLWADAGGVIETFPGAPAWVGTGLLGGVLGWLLFVHLPSKDKQISSLIADRDRAMQEKDERHDVHTRAITDQFNTTMAAIVVRYTEAERDRRGDFQASLTMIVNHCEKETSQTGAAIRKNLEGFGQLMEEVRDELRRFRGEGRPK